MCAEYREENGLNPPSGQESNEEGYEGESDLDCSTILEAVNAINTAWTGVCANAATPGLIYLCNGCATAHLNDWQEESGCYN